MDPFVLVHWHKHHRFHPHHHLLERRRQLLPLSFQLWLIFRRLLLPSFHF
jgi:hypothetical protein